ncbi:type VI secretion system-associated FHA domain protein TagH [Amaricoccus sp.]|uniref:type VI secretion system-associated FHA domain protein TagH n=1 Tax=Amaricoccus sp. TaxID=1872485 RepID=UPI001B665509|nr:type VI secretion system-associated FHA domain protein TagH [Amaricoccus sp.]MBP7000310.1 type VI secretion system-associated FHA domain protein TagH [Amaricoccus sp.]
MSVVLTLEGGPRPQAVRQMRLDAGALVIGRGAEADWRIDDPDMFVSRAHCTIAAGPDGYVVTDTSTGGLFVDQARAPLGKGNAARLADGMRLRLGDYVVSVALRDAAGASAGAPREAAAAGFDDFFAPRAAEPAPARPASLPDPFDAPSRPDYAEPEERAERTGLPVFDDPFTLDPCPAAPSGGGFSFDPGPAAPTPAPSGGGFSFDWDAPAPAVETPAPEPRREAARPPPEPAPVPPPRPAALSADAGRAAFRRGLGLDPGAPAADVEAEMEALGRAYRLMVEGYMHLLRKRAEEKGEARVAQTTIGAVLVNPLKFMPNADAALDVMLAGRAGFLGPEAAAQGAVRDLAQHHVAAWRGVQAALRRMIDRFAPAALEEELKQRSALETLLAGGRRAKLWELYEARYREIARSAETRFLGEVGTDFRDAYERGGEEKGE